MLLHCGCVPRVCKWMLFYSLMRGTGREQGLSLAFTPLIYTFFCFPAKKFWDESSLHIWKIHHALVNNKIFLSALLWVHFVGSGRCRLFVDESFVIAAWRIASSSWNEVKKTKKGFNNHTSFVNSLPWESSSSSSSSSPSSSFFSFHLSKLHLKTSLRTSRSWFANACSPNRPASPFGVAAAGVGGPIETLFVIFDIFTSNFNSEPSWSSKDERRLSGSMYWPAK